jgi:ribosomal-protein-alanine N-acetyltransferase
VTTAAPSGSDTSSDPPIRTAERADLVEVHRIEQAVFPQPWPFSALEDHLGKPGFLVAEATTDTQTIAGYIIADIIPNHGTPIGHIKDLAVRPACRRNGVATALLRRALSVLAAAGSDSAKLEVRETNDGAQTLYRQLGFEHHKTIRNYYSNGEDALILSRPVDATPGECTTEE